MIAGWVRTGGRVWVGGEYLPGALVGACAGWSDHHQHHPPPTFQY